MNTVTSFLPVQHVIDFSTDCTVCIDSTGSVASQEPAIVLKDSISDAFVGSGAQAVAMQDRLSEQMKIISCIQHGRITDREATQFLVSTWKLHQSRTMFSRFLPRAIGLVVSYRWGSVQQSVAQEVFHGLGFAVVRTISHGEVLSGQQKSSRESQVTSCVVYISYDYTDIYLTLDGKIVKTWTIQFGSHTIQEAIFADIMSKHACVLSQKEYATIRKECVFLTQSGNETIVVHGKNILSNEYVSLRITSKELFPAMTVPLERLIAKLKHILQEVSVGEREDLMHIGITLAGAGCELKGLDEYLQEQVQIPVQKVLRPQLAAALNAYQFFTKK